MTPEARRAALVLGSLAILLVASRKAEPSPTMPTEPKKPPGPEQPGKGPSMPPDAPESPPWVNPSDADGIALVSSPGPQRDRQIIDAVANGRALPIFWAPVDVGRDGHAGRVWVTSDALMLPVRVQLSDRSSWAGPCRVNASYSAAEAIARQLGAELVTTRISDCAWQQAGVRLAPQTSDPDALMASTARMAAHSLSIDRALARSGLQWADALVRPVGKDWVRSPSRVPGRAALFGWHFSGGAYKSPGGLAVFQPLNVGRGPRWHADSYADYSHTLTVVRRRMEVDGREADLLDVRRDPELYSLVSDEGPF